MKKKLQKKILYTVGFTLLLGGSNLFAVEQSPRDILNNAYEYIL